MSVQKYNKGIKESQAYIAELSKDIQGGTANSIIYQSSSDTTNFVPVGTKDQVLKVSSSGISWAKTPDYELTPSSASGVLTDPRGNIFYTTDSVTWELAHTIPANDNPKILDIAYDGTTYLMVTTSSDNQNRAVKRSTDLKNWTLVTTAPTPTPSYNRWTYAIYENGKFVLSSTDGLTIASSTDTVTWQSTVLSSANGGWAESIAYGEGLFVTNLWGQNISYRSTDAVTWTQGTLPTSSYWEVVAYGNGVFVAPASYSNYNGAVSTNGITWTSASNPNGSWCDITFANGLFVVVATYNYFGSNLVTSTDGVTWTQIDVGSGNYGNWLSVSCIDGQFVVVGTASSNDATISLKSTNGVSWTRYVELENAIPTTYPEAGYGRELVLRSFNKVLPQKTISGTFPKPMVASTYTVKPSDKWLYFTAGTTITLPPASANIGRELNFRNAATGNQILSASSNVITINGDTTPSNEIISQASGATRTVTLVSNGEHWVAMRY